MKTAFKKRTHQWVDARSLAMCRMIAEKIRREPELMGKAADTLTRWKKIKKPTPRALLIWEQIFRENSIEQILALLTEDTERGQFLRQCDPFCGILTEEERRQILAEYDET
jgi:hypothetical protein